MHGDVTLVVSYNIKTGYMITRMMQMLLPAAVVNLSHLQNPAVVRAFGNFGMLKSHFVFD